MAHRVTTLRTLAPSEHDEQAAVVRWAALMTRQMPELEWLYAVPNGGARDIVTAHRLRLEGVKRGVFDLGLDVARHGYHGLRIEMKRHGGSVSEDQRRWKAHYEAQGYRAEVCYGFEAAVAALTRYLGSET